MPDHSSPDYPLEEMLTLDSPDQYKALFQDTRRQIVDLVLERAATVSEIASAMGKPKGTIGHHMTVLEAAGLVKVVRTRKVRAIEAKYYGRTARTYTMSDMGSLGVDIAPDLFLTRAAAEYAQASERHDETSTDAIMSTLRHIRMPSERAREWVLRLGELAQEFASEPPGGDTTYGLLIAVYPTDLPHLPDGGTDT